MELKQGATLQNGKYTIIKKIGQGGFGITYLAEQTGLGEVTVKEFFIRDNCQRQPDSSMVILGTEANRHLLGKYMHTFIKEAKTLKKLRNRHIVSIHDVFEENGTAYYTMDYIPGGSLQSLLEKEGKFPEEKVLHFAEQLCDVLRFIHQRNYLHLDIKPSNILYDAEEDNLYLIDFGLSKHYRDDGEQSSVTPTGISEGFTPIEQYNPEALSTFTASTDIYAMGATLYKLLTAQRPPLCTQKFRHDNFKFPEGTSVNLCNAIKHAMLRDADDRPQSIDAWYEILLTGQPLLTDEHEDSVPDEKNNHAGSVISLPEETFITDQLSAPDSAPLPLQPTQNEAGEKKDLSTNAVNTESDNINSPKSSTSDFKKGIMVLLGTVLTAGVFIFYLVTLLIPEDTPMEKAAKLHKEGDYVQAFPLFKELAEGNNREAQFMLGHYYENGLGVEKDDKSAFNWYQLSAKRYCTEAEFSLALCYEKGIGTEVDEDKAIEWYERTGTSAAWYALERLKCQFNINEKLDEIAINNASCDSCEIKSIRLDYAGHTEHIQCLPSKHHYRIYPKGNCRITIIHQHKQRAESEDVIDYNFCKLLRWTIRTRNTEFLSYLYKEDTVEVWLSDTGEKENSVQKKLTIEQIYNLFDEGYDIYDYEYMSNSYDIYNSNNRKYYPIKRLYMGKNITGSPGEKKV